MCHPESEARPDLLELAKNIQDIIKAKYVDLASRAFTAAVENHTGKWFKVDLPEKLQKDFLALDQEDTKFVTREVLFHIAKDSLKVGDFGVNLAFKHNWKFVVLAEGWNLVG
jgi:hypothetical protein